MSYRSSSTPKTFSDLYKMSIDDTWIEASDSKLSELGKVIDKMPKNKTDKIFNDSIVKSKSDDDIFIKKDLRISLSNS